MSAPPQTAEQAALAIEDLEVAYTVGGEPRVGLTRSEPLDGVRETHLAADDPAALLARLQRNLDRDGDHELQQR